MCNKCSVISVSEFKLVNSIIENMSELQDTKHPVKETKAAIERKAPKETKGEYTPFLRGWKASLVSLASLNSISI